MAKGARCEECHHPPGSCLAMSRVWRRRAWKGSTVGSGDVGALEGEELTVKRVAIPLTSSSSSMQVVETKGSQASQGSQGGYRYTLVWRDGT